MRERLVLRSADELRALAHPLRIRLLSALQNDGPATATMLARKLGESSGATSFHLRQLGRYGLIEESPGLGRGRERWWEASARYYDVADNLASSLEQEAAHALVARVLEHDDAIVASYFARRERYAEPWRDTSLVTNYVAYLTPSEFEELSRRLAALFLEYARPDPAARPAEAARAYGAVRVVPWAPTAPEP